MPDRLRLGLAWQTLHSDNLGVCALAEGNLAIAAVAAKRAGIELELIEFCCVAPSGNVHERWAVEHGDAMSVRRILLRQSRVVSQMRECDVMLDIGEGDSFADIYGLKRFVLLAASKWIAESVSVPLVLSPQTIGPFKSPIARAVARHVMARAHRVFARDGLSMAYLRQNGLADNAEEVIDVAFRLPFSPRALPADGRVHVGVNVSGLLYNGGYSRDNQFGLMVDYAALIDGLLAELASRPDVVVHLVGHVNSHTFEVEDDYRVCAALAQRHAGMVLAPRFVLPSEAKSYISGLHFFTGARMHACIAAFSSGVAVVPMAYSRKFNGLFNSLGYTALADLKADDTAAAQHKVLAGLAERAALAGRVAIGNALAKQKLQRYEDYLVELFKGLRDNAH